MSNRLITPIIMAGGSGTRLWPVSREAMPKQFCDLGFGKSLFQKTLKRVENNMLFEKPVIVCSAKHETLVTMQAAQEGVEIGTLICEPEGRNTAAAIALAIESDQRRANSLYLVLASDHEIEDTAQFHADVISSRHTAMEERRIVLFGVKPTALETGYGYLRTGQPIGQSSCREILEFIEKPDAAQVEILVQDATCHWNSGMFFFRKDVVQTEMEIHTPDILRTVKASVDKADRVGKAIYPDAAIFSTVQAISFDYAVMEKTNHAAMKEFNGKWSDLGNWRAILESTGKEGVSNVTRGPVFDHGSNGCLVLSDGPVIGTCGLEDIVVVANRDALLVAHKDTVQGVRNIVDAMKVDAAGTVAAHVFENRPWGRFESLDRGPTHQVKRITVNPGGRLSLQYHFHRSEHWVVVSGVATVTVDDDVQELSACQQIFIPQGAVHRLENFTEEPVEIIEVQYGTYLGEDDIVRVEDVYDRPETDVPARVA